MGAGAAAGVKEALSTASPDDLKGAVEGLSSEDRKKLMAALGADGGAKAEAAKAEAPKAEAAKEPCWYGVVHTFNDGKAEDWWKAMGGMTPEQNAAMQDKFHGLGLHNHSFMPADAAGTLPLYCLWECKDDMKPEAFQKFIDGPDGPGEGVFVNKAYKIMAGASLPKAFDFASPPAPAAPAAPAGSMFWVFHEFKDDAASAAFWEWMGTLKTPEDWANLTKKNNDLGWENHSFCPVDPKGPAICIWESKADVSLADAQTFIDGPDGPGAGKTFNNKVYKAMAGSTLPPPKWAKDA